MHRTGSSGVTGGRKRVQRPVMFFALLLTLAGGCSSPGGSPRPSASSATTTIKLASCGTTTTAAGVKVHVEIARGHVSCGIALSVEQSYAKAVSSGLAPGNGGGGPVKIKGWTCQGFTTPVVDQTGNTSRCVRDGEEILEVLSLR